MCSNKLVYDSTILTKSLLLAHNIFLTLRYVNRYQLRICWKYDVTLSKNLLITRIVVPLSEVSRTILQQQDFDLNFLLSQVFSKNGIRLQFSPNGCVESISNTISDLRSFAM